MSISYRELNESELANLGLALPSDHKPSLPHEIQALNRTIALIRRATLAGELKKIPGQNYFDRCDAEDFARKIQNMPAGLERFFEPWHPPSQNECRWLLCGLDPGVARTEQELEEVWKDVCDAEEAVQRAIAVGRLVCSAKTDASPAERIYKEARFILPGELLRWAIEAGSFPRFVALAQDYGLGPAAAHIQHVPPLNPNAQGILAATDVALEDPPTAIVEALKAGNRQEAVQLWQKHTGQTKAHLYKKAGVHRSDYYKWESGRIPDASVKHLHLRRELLTS